MITDAKLDYWIQNKLNVLMIGRHGTGKSTMIKQAVERNGLTWKYFSTPTMDVLLDFVGIPKEKNDGNISYLEFIRPKEFIDNNFQMLFFDEFNRASSAKIQNCVMELLQFKSINGNKFNELEMIWAAINPEETDDEDIEYIVEKLDPAIKDRFHIIVETDDKPNRKFFLSKFGDNGKIAVGWWHSLDKKINKHISPRRLEYALDEFNRNGDMADVLSKNINIMQLLNQLSNGSFIDRLDKLFNDKNKSEAISSLKNENFYNGTIKKILQNTEYTKFFSSCFSPEKFNNLIITDTKFRNVVLQDDILTNENIENLKSIVKSNSASEKIVKQISDKIKNSFNDIEYFIDTQLKSKTDLLDNTVDRQKAISEILAFNIKSITAITMLEDLFAIVSSICLRTNSVWTQTTKLLIILDKLYVDKFGGTSDTLKNVTLKHAFLVYWLGSSDRIEKMKKKWEKSGLK